MARLSPQTFDPITAWRFRVQFNSLPDVSFYAKAINLPTIDNAPITIDYGNTQIKVKGKTKWNDVELTMYAYENMTIDQLWSFINDLHQKIDEGLDRYADEYKLDIMIQLLKPDDTSLATWTLVGAFANLINFGDLDYSAEEVVQPKLTISYDYALYKRENTTV